MFNWVKSIFKLITYNFAFLKYGREEGVKRAVLNVLDNGTKTIVKVHVPVMSQKWIERLRDITLPSYAKLAVKVYSNNLLRPTSVTIIQVTT